MEKPNLEDIDPKELATALHYALDTYDLVIVPNHWEDVETDGDDVTAIARRITGHDEEEA